jgi:hypothetical protein
MKYTNEQTLKIIEDYQNGVPVLDIANEYNVPTRSIVAKLAAAGVYKRQEYRNKRGEVPIKKEEYITRIAKLLEVNVDILESLEKANKKVLQLIEEALKK